MPAKIRIGVVGLGRIGWNFHCNRIAAHRRFTLAGVADPLKERLTEAADTFGCATFRKPEDLLAMNELDAVVIASPTHFHRPHALAAFRHGLHVYLEKPMALTLADARAIVREAKNHKRILTVYQPQRAAAYFQHLKRILAKGRIGKVYHIRRGRFRYVQRDDWQSLTKYGGGMLNNYGAHAIDLVLGVTGYDVKRVFGQLRRVASLGDAEDVVKVLYETRNGVLGEVEINQASATAPYGIQIWGTRGTIMYDEGVFHLRYVKGKLPKKALNRSLASTGRRYPRDEITFIDEDIPVNKKYAVNVYTNLANAVQKDAELLVKPEETLAVMKVMTDARRSAGKILHS